MEMIIKMIKRKFSAAFIFVIILGLSACGSEDYNLSDTYSVQGESITTETENADRSVEGQKKETQDEQASSAGEQQETQKEGAQDMEGNVTDDELEENLALYRAKREEWTDTSLGNGVTGSGGKAQSPEDFDLYFDTSAMDNFDARELVEAYDTAKSYVENTLGVEVTTKHTVYMCVDPRIWEIYEADDKGVAEGYEAENIFICEYCDNGAWKYLILVREGKGSAWEVIHNGSSYTEGEN
jgi:hypothetical protein